MDPDDKHTVTDMLINAGLAMELKTDFKKVIRVEKAKAKGKLLKVINNIYEMNRTELDSVIGKMVGYSE